MHTRKSLLCAALVGVAVSGFAAVQDSDFKNAPLGDISATVNIPTNIASVVKTVSAAVDTKQDLLTEAQTNAVNSGITSSLVTKLNGIAQGAEVNQNAFNTVKVGTTNVAADSKTDTLTLVAGDNVTITPDASNDKITIAATDTTYSAATTTAAGLMSAADKTKLDGVAEGAEVNVNADWNASSGDAQIMNKPSSLKNPNALTIGTATYDGSVAKTLSAGSNVQFSVDGNTITVSATDTTYTSLKNPNYLKYKIGTGSATNFYDGSTAKTIANGSNVSFSVSGDVLTISATDTTYTTLPNPNALTVGTKTYDGSAAVEITLVDLATLGCITNHQSLAGYVPTSRKVAGKALSSDVTLGSLTFGTGTTKAYNGSAAVNVKAGTNTALRISSNDVYVDTVLGLKTTLSSVDMTNVDTLNEVISVLTDVVTALKALE